VPTYDYRCDHCGHGFTKVQRFDEEPLAACPQCGKRPRRLLSKPAIVFKGSGWHVTDYRRPGEGGKSEASGDSGGTGDAAKPDAAKKDAGDKKGTTNLKGGTSGKSKPADAAAS
jgi:putative FmdB family regulatory protein